MRPVLVGLDFRKILTSREDASLRRNDTIEFYSSVERGGGASRIISSKGGGGAFSCAFLSCSTSASDLSCGESLGGAPVFFSGSG